MPLNAKLSGPTVKISEIMVAGVHRITPDMKLLDAVEVLIKHQISGAPVVDTVDNVITIMGEGDMLRLAASEGLEATISHCLPKLIQTHHLITLTEEDTFTDAYRIFLKEKIHRIPIVDGNGRLKGIVSRNTILQMFVEAHYGQKIRRKAV